MMGAKFVFRNEYSGTTFVVIGDAAADRMRSWHGWHEETKT